jgi:hypothetical protein
MITTEAEREACDARNAGQREALEARYGAQRAINKARYVRQHDAFRERHPDGVVASALVKAEIRDIERWLRTLGGDCETARYDRTVPFGLQVAKPAIP